MPITDDITIPERLDLINCPNVKAKKIFFFLDFETVEAFNEFDEVKTFKELKL